MSYDPVTGQATFHGTKSRKAAWNIPAPAARPTVRSTVRCLDCDRRTAPNPECPDALCADCFTALAKEGAR